MVTDWCERCGLSLFECQMWFGDGACPILGRPSGWRLHLAPWEPLKPVDLVSQPRVMRAISDAVDSAPPYVCPLNVRLPDGRVIKLDPVV